MCVLSIKRPIRKKSGNLFNDPRIFNQTHGYDVTRGQYISGVRLVLIKSLISPRLFVVPRLRNLVYLAIAGVRRLLACSEI